MIEPALHQSPQEPVEPCPLCRHRAAQPFLYHQDKQRAYYQCGECALVYVPRRFHLSATEEKAYYDLHENHLQDPGYEKFLSRCADPLLARLPAGAHGLDFGCGPAPLLANMLSSNGHPTATYDLYYHPESAVLEQSYDFVVSTEVVEHLSEPGEVITSLWQRLNRGGVLALMTKLVASQERFASWHYIRDPTHIVFFSVPTFSWLARKLNAELEIVGADVIFLQRRD
uniref:class I SAM-dependent methyltransferase n=1 Tax=Microbulbifer agarilyticus TaxID=260552 RepID=UPI000255A21D|nr:class I SAM-dependent methyltransferase [Microbulbifer agarilyticus]